MPERGLETDLDKVLGTLTNLFASDGDARVVAVLAMSNATIAETDYDGWDGGQHGYTIYLEVPQTLYHQLEGEHDIIEQSLREKAKQITRLYEREWIAEFIISTELVEDRAWREKALTWVSGQGITNQGRVRSDNLAPRQCDGLLFRSNPEIHLYRAFRSAGVPIAPLPVFVRGGETYRRIEVDFLVIKRGIAMVIEVDGDTVHRETPQEAHERLAMLAHEGVHVERVNTAACDTPEKAKECAAKMLAVLEKLRTNR